MAASDGGDGWSLVGIEGAVPLIPGCAGVDRQQEFRRVVDLFTKTLLLRLALFVLMSALDFSWQQF